MSQRNFFCTCPDENFRPLHPHPPDQDPIGWIRPIHDHVIHIEVWRGGLSFNRLALGVSGTLAKKCPTQPEKSSKAEPSKISALHARW
jgi:hypothetical protein